MELEIEEHNKELRVRTLELIHDNKISSEMAISLMNDSSYAYDVARGLVRMGITLFVGGELGLRDNLNDDDM